MSSKTKDESRKYADSQKSEGKIIREDKEGSGNSGVGGIDGGSVEARPERGRDRTGNSILLIVKTLNGAGVVSEDILRGKSKFFDD